jgi:hypothetical protein
VKEIANNQPSFGIFAWLGRKDHVGHCGGSIIIISRLLLVVLIV